MAALNIYGRPDTRQSMRQIMEGVPHVGRPARIANNTVRYSRADGATVTRLHNTDIVVQHADGTFTLNSGGYRTMTTKGRINRFSPAEVYSDRGIWYVRDPRHDYPVPFKDGMRVDASGLPQHVTPAKATAEVRRQRRLRARIKRFCDRVDHLATIPEPNPGDCWLCMLHDQSGKPMDAADPSHVHSHVQENYLHGSLIYNAMRDAGNSDQGIGYAYYFANKGERFSRDRIKRALRRYVTRSYGLPL